MSLRKQAREREGRENEREAKSDQAEGRNWRTDVASSALREAVTLRTLPGERLVWPLL